MEFKRGNIGDLDGSPSRWEGEMLTVVSFLFSAGVFFYFEVGKFLVNVRFSKPPNVPSRSWPF